MQPELLPGPSALLRPRVTAGLSSILSLSYRLTKGSSSGPAPSLPSSSISRVGLVEQPFRFRKAPSPVPVSTEVPAECLHLCDSLASSVRAFRAQRAWCAGLSARQVLSGDSDCVEPTPRIEVRARVYVVLRNPRDLSPRVYHSFGAFKAAVGKLAGAPECPILKISNNGAMLSLPPRALLRPILPSRLLSQCRTFTTRSACHPEDRGTDSRHARLLYSCGRTRGGTGSHSFCRGCGWPRAAHRSTLSFLVVDVDALEPYDPVTDQEVVLLTGTVLTTFQNAAA